MKPLFVTLAGLAATFGMAVPAHADGTDDQFLATVQTVGISFPDRGRAIAAGKWVCEKAGEGTQMADLVKIVESQNPALTEDKAAKFTAIAANVYCPKALASLGVHTP